jgi:uncharacterized protein YdbL (DUF1318 family)
MMRLFATLVVALAVAAEAQPQPPAVAGAIRSGVVGERFDGYLGFAAPLPIALQRQVSAINIERRNLYTQLSVRRGVTVNLVGIATGCELLGRVAVGQAYMLKDGAWRRRAAGQPAPHPDYCE